MFQEKFLISMLVLWAIMVLCITYTTFIWSHLNLFLFNVKKYLIGIPYW